MKAFYLTPSGPLLGLLEARRERAFLSFDLIEGVSTIRSKSHRLMARYRYFSTARICELSCRMLISSIFYDD